jgi:TolB-like protein/ketosteroid isomerase-like protein
MVVATGCTVAGIALVLTIQRPQSTAAPPEILAPPPPVGGAQAQALSSLWVLAIGVSRYEDPNFNLQFAAADAQSIDAALQRQAGGRLYNQVKTLVLTDDDVTRESILDNMERFLGQAGPNDIVLIFMAGHGVQDLATGSYYFLPHPATPANLLTAGLRMTDFDEVVRVLRRNVRGIVVMLDTCHAGSLRLAARGLVSADDLAARLSAGEGFFLLAATKPGEESREKPELRHGVFTYAVLEGLSGPADADHDGLVTVSELFGHVARRVPRLTDEQQHPYHKMEGTDLVFAAVPRNGQRAMPTPPMVVAQNEAIPMPSAPTANTIGVMEFNDLRSDPQHEWIGKALRVAFNTELSKVKALHVYSPELIDRVARARGPDNLSIAQQLGIGKFLTGSFHVVGNTIRIDARIIDADTGVQEGSDSVEGDQSAFFDLQKRLVISMLRRLPVELSPEEGRSIQGETNTDVDAYRLLLETEGVVGDAEQPQPQTPRPSPTPPGPHARAWSGGWKLATLLSPPAYAEEPEAPIDAQVHEVLEEYRGALQQKDLDRLAALYVTFTPRQRQALHEYLQNAAGLIVEVSDVAVMPHGDGVAVSYTRRDRFIDTVSGKPQRLEVRLTKILVRDNGQWKMAGGQ